MPSDPRLANVVLLALAAKRCQARRHVPTWQTTVGLSSLLDAARALPQREPVDLATIDTTSGLGKLLAEARQWQQERDHGA